MLKLPKTHIYTADVATARPNAGQTEVRPWSNGGRAPVKLRPDAGRPGGGQALAWGLLLLGGLSDAADGWLARRAGGGSVWGARLDPLTDKVLILAPLLWLGAQGALPLWAVWLLLARELLISGWRAGQGSGGPASWSGKAKTI